MHEHASDPDGAIRTLPAKGRVKTRGPLPDPHSARGHARAKAEAKTLKAEIVPVRQVPVKATRHPAQVPTAPRGLSPAGRASWRESWALPWTALADRGAIANLARLEDERALLTAAIRQHGVILSKVLVSPKGDVVGDELYANPASRELRRVDAAILSLRDRLGLTPLYRARLGLALVELEEKENQVVAGLRARYRSYGEQELNEGGPVSS